MKKTKVHPNIFSTRVVCTTLKKAQTLFTLKLLSGEKIKTAINGLDFKPKDNKPKLLSDEEVLVVASAEMKCLASQPQKTKLIAGNLHNLV